MTEEDYLESFIDGYNLEIKREKELAEMKKEMNGQYSVAEIIEAIEVLRKRNFVFSEEQSSPSLRLP